MTTGDFSNQFSFLCIVQATMVMMEESIVNRYLRCVMEETIRNNRKEILCPCQK
jgi:hypothetical protein